MCNRISSKVTQFTLFVTNFITYDVNLRNFGIALFKEWTPSFHTNHNSSYNILFPCIIMDVHSFHKWFNLGKFHLLEMLHESTIIFENFEIFNLCLYIEK